MKGVVPPGVEGETHENSVCMCIGGGGVFRHAHGFVILPQFVEVQHQLKIKIKLSVYTK